MRLRRFITRRFVVRACVFLLLGAIVSITVAWGFACFTDYRESDRWTIDQPALDWLTKLDQRISWFEGEEGTPIDDPWTGVPPYCYERRWTGRRHTDYVGPPYGDHGFGVKWVVVIRCGWPCESLTCVMIRDPSDMDRWRVSAGANLTDHATSDDPAALSCRPVLPGFAINTAFFAVIVWLIWRVPLSVRRFVQSRSYRRRGLCVKCGYDLRGEYDAGCPECGWNRREH